MKRSCLVVPIVPLLALLTGCGFGTYTVRPSFEYRVVDLRAVHPALESAPAAGARAPALDRLEADGVLFEPSAGSTLAVVDAARAPFASAAPPGTVIVSAGSEGRIKLTLPPRTRAAGFDIYGVSASGPGHPAVRVAFDGSPEEHVVPLRWPDAKRTASAFIGIVGTGASITTMTWDPAGAPAPTGIANVVIETK